ncbi:MAG TPA: hypothetical protein VGM80_10465 [Gaiellaceae bacterium]|jgi:hypothetical protein
MPDLALPPVELPNGALVLFEHMAVDDLDRSGNWRFYVSGDGGFYQARNERLFVEQSDLGRTDPSLFWNVALPDAPQRQFDEKAMESLRETVEGIDFEKLGNGADRAVQVERWTSAGGSSPGSAVVVNGKNPRELAELRRTIDGLVAKQR